jgi:hypothetical protein
VPNSGSPNKGVWKLIYPALSDVCKPAIFAEVVAYRHDWSVALPIVIVRQASVRQAVAALLNVDG